MPSPGGSRRATNLEHFHEGFFRNAISRHIDEYCAYYSDRLATIYIRGSVHRNEGVVGISDLDILVFLRDEFTEKDRAYWDANRNKLEAAFPGTQALGYAWPVDRVMALPSLLAQLQHDATLVFGDDLVGDREFAQPDYFPRLWLLIRFLAGIDQSNRSESVVPEEPRLRLRRLARMAVLGGAGYLLAHNKLKSYCGIDVLPDVLALCPQWREFLDYTRQHYTAVVPASGDEVRRYEAKVLGWVVWVGVHRGRLRGANLPASVDEMLGDEKAIRQIISEIPEGMVSLER